jgi:hypothetical protein
VVSATSIVAAGICAKSSPTASSKPSGCAKRATVAVGGTGLYALYYDEPNDKYVALKDGAAFGLEWSSVGSAVSHGSDFRFGGIRISRASGVNAGTNRQLDAPRLFRRVNEQFKEPPS